jgi:hypothetical protein
VQLVEQAPERVDGAVGGDLEDELVLVGCGCRKELARRVQQLGIGEVESDVAARDAALQFGGGSFGDDPALVEHRDPVGQLVCLVEVLGGEQDGDPGGGQRADDLPHGATAARVQAGGGLVEEDHPGPADESHRQVEPSPHPA